MCVTQFQGHKKFNTHTHTHARTHARTHTSVHACTPVKTKRFKKSFVVCELCNTYVLHMQYS